MLMKPSFKNKTNIKKVLKEKKIKKNKINKEFAFKRISENKAEWVNKDLSLKAKTHKFIEKITKFTNSKNFEKLKKEYPLASKFFEHLFKTSNRLGSNIFFMWSPGDLQVALFVLPIKFKKTQIILEGFQKKGISLDSILKNEAAIKIIFEKSFFIDNEIDMTIYNDIINKVETVLKNEKETDKQKIIVKK